jgi:hypothetical protein
MKLYAFGDSWTAGQGANIRIENSLDSVEERRIFRNNKSWSKFLSESLDIECSNKSVSGCSNNDIFNSVIDSIKSNEIDSGDLIIIMWSSSLRDGVSFFSEKEWHVWGKNYASPKHRNKIILK